MQTIALISGLIGEIVSAILGFGARLILDKRTQKDAERRLSFVYLVKVISDIVAADIAVRTFIKLRSSVQNGLISRNWRQQPRRRTLRQAMSQQFNPSTEQPLYGTLKYSNQSIATEQNAFHGSRMPLAELAPWMFHGGSDGSPSGPADHLPRGCCDFGLGGGHAGIF